MLLRNKHLFLGAAGALALWLIVYLASVRSNWSDYSAKLAEADAASTDWEKHYLVKAGLLPKKDAEKALDENGRLLSANLQTLQRIELGIPQWLHPFTIQAAGGGDPNNYLDQMIKKTQARSNDVLHIPVPNGLGIIGDRAGDDPVSVKLLRLFMADTFINACSKAGVTRITWIKHYSPRMIFTEADEANQPEEGADPAPPAKKGASKAPAPIGASRIVQFPMKVSVQLPEKSMGKLLFELQQPSVQDHGYLCLRGFSVAAKDPGSGLVDAAVAMSGLLNENYVREQGIVVKGEDDRPGAGRKVDLKGW